MSKTICVLGGSGFVGSALVNRLVSEGWQVRIPSRRPERHRQFQVLPQVRLKEVNIHDPEQLAGVFHGCDAVVNLIGILNEPKDNGEGFERAHVQLAEKIVVACKKQGVQRVLQMSALHADAQKGTSYYLRSKGKAEDLMRASGLEVSVFKPSVIFGEGDAFLNQFAALLKIFPFFLPLACADSKFAPVWVGDVADGMLYCLNHRATIGQSYPMCGPRQYRLKDLVAYTAQLLKLRRSIIPLPDNIARLQASIMQRLPGQLLTMDNYRSLQTDSVCDADDFARLGIQPSTLESIAPTYLAPSHQREQYHQFRLMARR